MPLPLEIIGLDRPTIELVWEDEHRSEYRARDLRLACRCAACIEEMTGVPLLDPKSVPVDVKAAAIELMGQYAIAIRWSDGHVGGIYNFRDLRANCPCAECTAERARQAIRK
jgi:ATP-binding protein involved in chromosome partitioning